MRTALYDAAIGSRTTIASRLAAAGAGLLPAAVAVAWLPLRGHLPNTDVALVLVASVAGVGFVAGRAAVVAGSLGAGAAFDLLHTRPYGHLAITQGRDVLTTALLVVVGLTVGSLAARLSHYRRAAASDADAFALVTDAAGLVATGGDPRLVVEALTEELRLGLGLRACELRAGVPDGALPWIGRQGDVVRPAAAPDAPAVQLVLPVWVAGAVDAHFLLTAGAAGLPTQAQGRLAVGLADQVGAALAQRPPDPVPPGRRLRLVRSGGG